MIMNLIWKGARVLYRARLASSGVILLSLALSGLRFPYAAQSPSPASRLAENLRIANVPKAMLECTPEECEWWEKVLAASNKIKESEGDKKDRKRFVSLLKEGIKKSYRVPLRDRPSFLIIQPIHRRRWRPEHLDAEGKLIIEIELLFDGTVGKVTVLQSVDRGIDKSMSESMQDVAFLPAVKDRKFVSSTMRSQSTHGNESVATITLSRIPAVSVECTTEEADWWNRLREACAVILYERTPSSSAVRTFHKLLRMGEENGYRPPVADFGAVTLATGRLPRAVTSNLRGLRGEYSAIIELLPDGTVGRVDIVSSLRKNLDSFFVEFERQRVFLPGVKSRTFVTSTTPSSVRSVAP